MRVGVLASGSGSNLQALLDACRPPQPAEVALVACNVEGAGAVARAERARVATWHIADPADGDALLGALRAHGVELVVLAGYLKLVPATVVAAYDGRMLNIHPALLPSFGGKGMYGRRVHEAVLASGATVSGPTVHLVTAEYDRGPIVAQWPVPVLPHDTPETLRDRVLAMEHQLLPAVVLAAARAGRPLRLTADGTAFAVTAAPVVATMATGENG
ncbi:MAG: phosphoribosylglycinamide formyltransferase [Gemmatimonadota bacterium]|nr:phosphoribosylglycinamide formyltransferase [Gemmatimonadota bacterium]MDH4350001.1 phosphoribosylglycinamide formyltransferase [Gemmatimonadota bacterium]